MLTSYDFHIILDLEAINRLFLKTCGKDRKK